MAETSISHLRSKSVLHYWLQLSQEPTQDYIRLLDYLSELDLGRLEIALSERDIRQLYVQPLKKFAETHQIIIAKKKRVKSHLDWVLNRGLNNYIRKLVISFNLDDKATINFDDYNIRFPNLLDISCWSITPKICRLLSLYCPNLHTLRILYGARMITDKCIDTICASCCKLKYIQISAPPGSDFIASFDGALTSISKYCKELEVLKLNHWDDIRYNTIPRLSELTNLVELDLDMVSGWSTSFSTVFASNTKLETVKLGGHFPHDTILRALGTHCPSLKHVDLGVWAWLEISDVEIIAMVKGCPLLESIELSSWNCASEIAGEGEVFVPTVSVTNAALYAIAQHCPHLKLFKISSVDPLAFDDTGLDAIVNSCPQLQAIYKDDTVYYAAPGVDTYDHSYNAYYRENGDF